MYTLPGVPQKSDLKKLGADLCSEGPVFRGSYVPSFLEKARNISTLIGKIHLLGRSLSIQISPCPPTLGIPPNMKKNKNEKVDASKYK